MKTYKRLFIIFCCTIVLFFNLFMCHTTPVFAKPTLDENGHLHVYNWDDIKDSAADYIMYFASSAGAIFKDRDFAKYVQNKDAWVDYWTEDNVTIVEDGTSVTFSKDLMDFIKQCIDEYVKQFLTKEENGGFYLLPTTNFNDVPASNFINAQQARTFRNILIEKGVLVVLTKYNGNSMKFIDPFSDPDNPIMLVGNQYDINIFKNNPSFSVDCSFFGALDWTSHKYRTQVFPEDDRMYTSISDAVDYETASTSWLYVNTGRMNFDLKNPGSRTSESFIIYSTTGERIRVFVSQNAAKNYSMGYRKVYFTENYYTYEPDDLTVAVDDLQKSVDDLQKVIDELLEKINEKSSEKEIEELLRQILEELRNGSGGSGGGSGSGGGTASADLKETNSWLSKIYATLTGLGNMLERYLSSIASDLGDIRDRLEGMPEDDFGKKMDAFLGDSVASFSEIGALAKTKFPLSIPNDLKNLLAAVAPGPASPAVHTASYSRRTAASRDSGGFISVMEGGDTGDGYVHLSGTGAPVFHLPVVVESAGLDYAVTVDMSGFQTVADLSRTFFTLVFILGLINLTIRIAGLWGDIVA